MAFFPNITTSNPKRRRRLINLLIILVVSGALIALDQWLKWFVFKNPIFNGEERSLGWIGFRRVKHPNSSLFNWLQIQVPPAAFAGVGTVLALLVFLIAVLNRRKIVAFCLAITLAGLLGNTLDWYIFGYVRDVIYTPWADRGTFNIADVLIVGGAVSTVAVTITCEIIASVRNRAVV
ncbi:signal peptidase II [Mycoplasma sp. ATU-Cv-508]|uniref:signal peptidase II n=1 Tax=Mycoplasma sp. ATU-Cv-508 TaxID=2048001 RepID=UPI0011E4D925